MSGEEQGMFGNELRDLATAGEAELAVEFAGIVEAEDLFGLFGEEFFGSGEESEGGVAVEEGFEVGDSGGVWLDGTSAWGIWLGTLGSVLLGDFEEGGGEGDGFGEIRVRVLQRFGEEEAPSHGFSRRYSAAAIPVLI